MSERIGSFSPPISSFQSTSARQEPPVLVNKPAEAINGGDVTLDLPTALDQRSHLKTSGFQRYDFETSDVQFQENADPLSELPTPQSLGPYPNITAPPLLPEGAPRDILVGTGQTIVMEEGVTMLTTPEELLQQMETSVQFSYEGHTIEGVAAEMSNGQRYFLEKNGHASFYSADPNLPPLSTAVEFQNGEIQDMRTLGAEEQAAFLGLGDVAD